MTISQALEYYDTNEPKGEFVLVIEGIDREKEKESVKSGWLEMDMEEHLNVYLEKGLDKKEAMKAVAKDRGISKSDVYKALL